MLNGLKKVLLNIVKRYKWRGRLQFDRSSRISRFSKFEGMNKIGRDTEFTGEMGLGSYIANNSIMRGKIGRFSSIGSHVRVVQGTHPYKTPYATTSPYFYSPLCQNGFTSVDKLYFEETCYADDERHDVIIGSDVWICYDVKLIAGVTVGDGAVLLTGSVVSKDVPPYAIVGGVPAKIVGYRYDEDTINRLLKLRWWNQDIEWLNKNHDLLRDVDMLLRMNKNNF